MRIYYSDHFILPLPPGHRFPMCKYAALRERVLSSEYAVGCRVPDAARDDEVSARTVPTTSRAWSPDA